MEEITRSGNDILMPGEAARMLGVTTKTLATMRNLNPIVLPSGHRRYSRSEVLAMSTPTALVSAGASSPQDHPGTRASLSSPSSLAPELDSAGT